MNYETSYRVFPLGDSAITIDFGNRMDEKINQQVMALFEKLLQQPLPGMIEAVPAYSSLTIYYDMVQLHKRIKADTTVYEWMKEQVEAIIQEPLPANNSSAAIIRIPVCYDIAFAPDLEEMATIKNISIEEIIEIHTAKKYRVYMLGFLPGFPYLGEVDEKIVMPRKQQPRQQVAAGSVGIAGKQTGIYPLASPGGWQIIGRTPVKLFDADNDKPTLLKAGDWVEFYSITIEEYENKLATEALKH
jgi:inhibitor of KinA